MWLCRIVKRLSRNMLKSLLKSIEMAIMRREQKCFRLIELGYSRCLRSDIFHLLPVATLGDGGRPPTEVGMTRLSDG